MLLMRAMLYAWLALTLLCYASAAPQVTAGAEIDVAEASGTRAAQAQDHSDTAAPRSDNGSVAEPSGATAARPDAPHAQARRRANPRTLDRNASELAWRNWLQSPESRDPAAPPRRITPKSVFIAPYNCPDGRRIQGEGCVKKAHISSLEHEKLALEQLNSMQFGGALDEAYDYDDVPAPAPDAAAGPLQLDLLPPAPPPPLAVAAGLTAAASQSYPYSVSAAVEKDPQDAKKPDPQEAELEAELEKLKLELERISPPRPNDPPTFNKYGTLTVDKPKRDSGKDNKTSPATGQDQGQKEVIFGHVAVDHVQYLTINQSDIKDINNLQASTVQETHSDQTLSTTEPTTHPTTETDAEVTAVTAVTAVTTDATGSEPPTAVAAATTDAPATSTHPAHNLKEHERPTKLHPEIDYSDLGEAVKIISRYAEVSTDDTFRGEPSRRPDDAGPLGTRTKLAHRRRARPRPPAGPSGSIYDDRVSAHVLYPAPGYFRYPAPPPPPDYPFRHVQEYWARPEQFLGPYAHANPRRHQHSPRRARRPDPSVAPLAPRHWFSGDGAAER